MLHDELPLDEVVDSEAALEFMKEATKLASATELEDIADRLEEKSALFRELLAPERVAALGEHEIGRLLGSIFTWKRKGGRLLRAVELPLLAVRAECSKPASAGLAFFATSFSWWLSATIFPAGFSRASPDG